MKKAFLILSIIFLFSSSMIWNIYYISQNQDFKLSNFDFSNLNDENLEDFFPISPITTSQIQRDFFWHNSSPFYLLYIYSIKVYKCWYKGIYS